MNEIINDSTVKEYADSLNEWLDSLTLSGKTGRRAVFVERSLKRKFKHMISQALNMRYNQIPVNWYNGRNAFILLTLWHLTINISRKFKTEVREDFKFRKLLTEL